MCIIVQQPIDHRFKPEAIADFYSRNKDGFGVMWHTPDVGVQAIKMCPANEQEAIEAYYKYAAGRQCVLHYRMATSGPKDRAHAHPFQISPHLCVVHNGVLSGCGSSTESDTAEFVRLILRPLLGRDYRRLKEKTVSEAIAKLVSGSSFVFLDVEGHVTRIGNTGLEWDGCWYSNTYAWDAPSKAKAKQWGSWSDRGDCESWEDYYDRKYGGKNAWSKRDSDGLPHNAKQGEIHLDATRKAWASMGGNSWRRAKEWDPADSATQANAVGSGPMPSHGDVWHDDSGRAYTFGVTGWIRTPIHDQDGRPMRTVMTDRGNGEFVVGSPGWDARCGFGPSEDVTDD